MTFRRTASSLLLACAVLAPAASAQIGTNFCTANANSTGSPSAIGAVGSTDVALNDVTLQVSGLPANQFGLFITSQTPTFVANAGGSNGNLCIGGSLGRFNSALVNSGPAGTASLVVDLTAVPNSTQLYAVMPGDTVYFQLWHRDVVGPGFSNFSPGHEVTFDAAPGLSFQNDVYPLLTQPNINADACVVCHGGLCGLDMGSTAQEAYNALVNVQAGCCFPDIYVVPGDANASVLYQKLGSPACGQAMPFGGTFAGDPNVVRDWINAGAPF